MAGTKKDHRKHLCVLKEQGLDDWLQRLSNRPTVICRYCGARANSLRNICAVRLTRGGPMLKGSGSRGREKADAPSVRQDHPGEIRPKSGADHA